MHVYRLLIVVIVLLEDYKYYLRGTCNPKLWRVLLVSLRTLTLMWQQQPQRPRIAKLLNSLCMCFDQRQPLPLQALFMQHFYNNAAAYASVSASVCVCVCAMVLVIRD